MSDEWSAGSPLPDTAFGVRWSDGTVECRFRLLHPHGSLIVEAGEKGTLLYDPATDCSTCSSACSS